MALPPSLKMIPVFGNYVNRDGSPAEGWISFSPSRVVTVEGVVVLAQGFIAHLDELGNFQIDLPATDAENLDQVDWSYRVIEGVRGGRMFNLRVPTDTQNGLDLTQQAPAIPIRDPQSRLSPLAYSGSADDLLGLAQAVREIPGWGMGEQYTLDLPGELGYTQSQVKDDATLQSTTTFVLRWADQLPGQVFASPTGLNPGTPEFRSLVPSDIPALEYASKAQGLLADSAVQSSDLAPGAFTGSYLDLSNLPILGTAAARDIGFFASAAQGTLADQAIPQASLGQPKGPVPLDTSGLIDEMYLPPAALTSDVISVAGLGGVIGKGALITALALSQVAMTGSYRDLTDAPDAALPQQNADWAAVSGVTRILNKPLLGTSSAKDIEFFLPTSMLGAANGVAQLGADNKLLASQLPASITGQMRAKGPWDASSGTTPDPAPESGWYWLVTTAGTTSINGINSWNIGDWICFDSVMGWYKCDNTDAVVRVAGLEGEISATSLQAALGLNTAAYQPATAFATASQGAKADTALQDPSQFATAAQGAKADSAVQPNTTPTLKELVTTPIASGWGWQAMVGGVIKLGLFINADGTPALVNTVAWQQLYFKDDGTLQYSGNFSAANIGTAAAKNIGDFATAAQGAKADAALAQTSGSFTGDFNALQTGYGMASIKQADTVANQVNGPGIDPYVTTLTMIPANTGCQIAVGLGSNRMSFRGWTSWSGWSAWAEVWTTQNLNPANFATASHNHDAAYLRLNPPSVYQDANAVTAQLCYMGVLVAPTVNTATGSWENIINACDANWGFQLSHGFFGEDVFVRSRQSGAFLPWRTLWHSGNFNPANYAALTGANFTGEVLASDLRVGTTAGYASWVLDAGYMRCANAWTRVLHLTVDSGMDVTGAITATGQVTAYGFMVNGDWYRTNGSTGWYNETWAGGWYMTDATYVRSYNNKAVLASDFVISSDRNLKKNISDMAPRARLRPRTFTMRDTGKDLFGFIAQELEKDYPEAVGTLTTETGRHIKQVSYPILVAALAAQVNALQDRVDELSTPWLVRLWRKVYGRQ